MQNIRTMGGAGGIFHILVPGVFLFLNIVGCAYLFPLSSPDSREEIARVLGNPAMGIVITLGFGYLIGVILRIFRSELPDQMSAGFLRHFDPFARPPETAKNRYAYESFPYVKWLGQSIHNLPDDAKEFYDNTWGKANSKTFLNFAKLLVISEDKRAAEEIYAAESLCRYISGMLYALIAAAISTLAVAIAQFITLQIPSIILLLLLVGYLIAIGAILFNYRFMRIKEVQTVFFAAYKNRHLFCQGAADNCDPDTEKRGAVRPGEAACSSGCDSRLRNRAARAKYGDK